jgi:hypothetical protein
MMTAEKLRQRVSKVEALYLGAATPGERVAAGSVLRRLKERLAEVEPSEDGQAVPNDEHAKWRQSGQTRDARGRWIRSTSDGEGHDHRAHDPHEQQDGSTTCITFRLRDRWARYLLLALVKQYGVRTYRYRRWPELTVMTMATRS